MYVVGTTLGLTVTLPVSSAMGQTVVVTAMTSVVTFPMRAGQLVTVGAHDVIVYVVVA